MTHIIPALTRPDDRNSQADVCRLARHRPELYAGLGRELTGEHTETAGGLGNYTALELFDEFRQTGNTRSSTAGTSTSRPATGGSASRPAGTCS
jgi:hypothetical protein